MFGRAGRTLPALGAALAALLVSTGSIALAGDDHREGHSKDGDSHHPGLKKQHCHEDQFSAWDEQWLMMSIEGDRFEIAGGKIAQEKAARSEVRELGARLVEDHSKSLEDAIEVANELGIEVPDSPSPTQQWALRVVARFSGEKFDRWYSDLEVQDHKQDIQEAEDEVEKGCNAEIRHLASEDLPVLEQHLALAEAALEASQQH